MIITTRYSSGFRSLMAAIGFLGMALPSTVRGWQVSGTVKSSAGTALAGVVVTVKDSSASLMATTDSAGVFSIGVTTGISASEQRRGYWARMAGDELVVQGPEDGPIELAIVYASGKALWKARAFLHQGTARVALARELRHGAVFLRLRHGQGTSYQTASSGANGFKLSAVRAAAGNPVLVFKKSGYSDTTYAMTAASQTGIVVVMSPIVTCALPSTFKWKDNATGPIASPSNGWTSIKDFSSVTYNGQHLVYMSLYSGGYKSAVMAPFTNWSDAANAVQTKMNISTVAPEIMYFTPKKQWVLTYQWGSAKFNYMTSSDPTKPNDWGGTGALLTEDITKADGAAFGPIDQVTICDSANCYLFYAGDNGHIYRASMPIGNFPGVFSGSKSILQDTKENLFEAVEVYTVKGTGTYLMIVECMGAGGRYFRAFTATNLGGTWTSLNGANNENTPFAGKKNVTFTKNWTNDISHGDIVRSSDETRTIDPCNLQMIYQGYDPSFSGSYDTKPYKLGQLTWTK
ncbi:MAG TPA: non-reducing end alpha-L-arabinofuranosidase family hydrolase [Fibrobacteria bacterium]|nr:non-reducing end alpha-L-arabinofuranosidase family hydrolase [Fibrobacteria bacterium]